MSDATQWANVYSEKSNYILKKKWKVRYFFLQKAIDFNFRGKQCILQLCMYLHTHIIYCNYFHFLSNEFYVHYAVCYNRKVALNSILNYKKNITSSSVLQTTTEFGIKRCRYTFSHQISMLPLPKNMKNDFSAALPPMQYNA